MEEIKLRPYQEEVHKATVDHFRSQERFDPVVINASVGSGKSFLIASIAKHVIDAAAERGKEFQVLVLQRQSELASQNSEAAWQLGVKNSIFSASLNLKSIKFPVVFGTEGSICNALHKQLKDYMPNVILIDESHMVCFDDPETQFMKIITVIRNRRRQEGLHQPFIAGYTGSPFRGIQPIVGSGFWSKQVGDISTDFLIDQGYLVPPVFGWPEESVGAYDFSEVKQNQGSWEFNERQLNSVISKEMPKTVEICKELIQKTVDRNVVLLFASTQKHAKSIMKILVDLGIKEDLIGLVTDSISAKRRIPILDSAKKNKIKFLINVNCLTTGVNIPTIDVIAFLRPVGSLTLLIQAIGRGLRLCDDLIKKDCLILDYADIMARLGDMYHNPILEEAQLQKSKKEHCTIPCPACGTENSEFARRCINRDVQDSPDGRCEYFFKSKECPECGTENDIVASECRSISCKATLRSPEEALHNKAYNDAEVTEVLDVNFRQCRNDSLEVKFILKDGRQPVQYYHPHGGNNPQINKRIYYNNFVKNFSLDSEMRSKLRNMSVSDIIRSKHYLTIPVAICARYNESKSRWNIGNFRYK